MATGKNKKERQHPVVLKKPAGTNVRSGAQAAKITRFESNKNYFELFIIIIISFIAYLPVLSNGFVNWDDDHYIQNNPLIHTINLKEIFTGFVMGNYHPFTMLIYSIEYHFFGLNAKGFHAFNLLIHLLNVILVFRAVLLLSDKRGVALLASLLFGIHPMHVESVAWASELKDLLYVFFFLASYIFYLQYLKNRQRKFYFYCLLFFLLSLFSKAMAVSLPVVLLLTDYFKGRKINRGILLEKAPFFALSFIFGILAIYAQKSGSAIHINYFPIPQRFVFASYGFITYLIKLLVPLHLCACYSYPATSGASIPIQYYVYPFLFSGLAIFVFYSLRFTKKILFGMGFFTITVFLVLQLLPVGSAIMADRYSYLPSVGIFYLIGEGVALLWNQRITNYSLKMPAISLLGIALVLYSVKTYSQCNIWKNSLTLWNDVISQDQTISVAYNNRANYFKNEKRYDEALSDYNKAIALKPNYAEAYNNRGSFFMDTKKNEEALSDFNKAILFQPDVAQQYYNRGIVLCELNRSEEALNDFNKTIALSPDYAEAYNNRGFIFENGKKYVEALSDYNKAIQLNPDNVNAYTNRANVLNSFKRYEEAISDYNTAIQLVPNNVYAYTKRGNLLNHLQRHEEALRDFNKIVALNPENAVAYNSRGIVYNDLKRYDEALNDINKAIEMQPDYALAYYCRGVTEYNLGKMDNACGDFQRAVSLGYMEAKNAYLNICH